KAASGPPSILSRPSERAGSRFEPLPSLEESPLQVLEVDKLVSGSGSSTYRMCRHAAGPLSRFPRDERSLGFAEPRHFTRDTPLNPNGRRYPHLENKWLRLLLPIILPATISPPCWTSPLPAAICRKAPSSRALLLRSRRTWPSLTSA